MCASFTRIQLEDWLKTIKIPANSKVLDIGGSQNPVINRIKQEHIISSEFKILDLEKPHEKKVAPDLWADLNIEFWHDEDGSPNLDIYDNSKEHDFDFYLRYFNVAFCMEVSEYWYDPMQALTNINNLLEKDGILYISFSFIYPVHNPVDQDYLRYTPRGVEKLLEETGFEILEMKPRLEASEKYIEPEIETKLGYEKAQELRGNRFIDWAVNEGMRPAKGYSLHDCVGSLIKAKKI